MQRMTWHERILIFPGVLYLLLMTFEGALRYYLYRYGLEQLVYLPKLLMLAVYVVAMIRMMVRRKMDGIVVAAVALTLWSVLVGWYHVRNTSQVLFGVWILLPLIYGVLVGDIFYARRSRRMPVVLAAGLWGTTVVGIVVDSYWALPWSGFLYELGSAVVEGAREWTTFGVERCAGFTRASFAASYLVLFAGLYWIVFTAHRIRWLVWMITGLCLVLTTHKTAIACYGLLTVIIMVRALPKRLVPFVGPVLRCMVVMLFVIGALAVPASSFVGFVIPNSYLGEMVLSSLDARLVHTWPDALRLIVSFGNVILGRGVGGIGAAQLYYESLMYNPGDNMYVYLYGYFGVLALVVLVFWVWSLKNIITDKMNKEDLFCLLCSSIILAQGWTTNGIEMPLIAMVMGMNIKYVMQRHMELYGRLLLPMALGRRGDEYALSPSKLSHDAL